MHTWQTLLQLKQGSVTFLFILRFAPIQNCCSKLSRENWLRRSSVGEEPSIVAVGGGSFSNTFFGGSCVWNENHFLEAEIIVLDSSDEMAKAGVGSSYPDVAVDVAVSDGE